MLNFQPLQLEDITKLRPYFETCTSRISDQTPGAAVMWREYFHTQYAIEDGVLYFQVIHYGGELAFTAPIGAQTPEAYGKLIDYCRQTDTPLVLCMLPEDLIGPMQSCCPQAELITNEIWSDYLYDAQSMVTFAGRKLSGQRNHVNKFKRLYENWAFEPIDAANLADARAFTERFIAEHKKDSATLEEGDRKTLEVLDHYELYGMLGGVLRVDGAIVGISIAEKLGDTLFIHVEKCLREYEGSYPMMVQCFAKHYVTEDIHYINREEDDGDPGLRTSKQSYHPVALLKKYTVRV